MTDRTLRRFLPSTTSLSLLVVLLIVGAASPLSALRFPRNNVIEIAADAPDTSVELVARLEIPDTSFTRGFKPPLVILIHQFGMDGYKWGTFTEELVRSGLAYLAVDLRGHGLSIYDLKLGRNRALYSYIVGEYQKFPGDVAFLVSEAVRRYPAAFDTSKYAIVGAALGGNTGLIYASVEPKVKYIAMISPGLEYNDLRIVPVLREFDNRPILLAYSDKDVYATFSVDLLTDILTREFDIYQSSSVYSGNRLLNAEPPLQGKILQDLTKYLLGK